MNEYIGKEAANQVIDHVEEIDGKIYCYSKDNELLQIVTEFK